MDSAPTPGTAMRVLSSKPDTLQYTPASPLNTQGLPDGAGWPLPGAMAVPSKLPSGTKMSSTNPRGFEAPKYEAPPAPQM